MDGHQQIWLRTDTKEIDFNTPFRIVALYSAQRLCVPTPLNRKNRN
jgi:hypothetical protein